jgi:hypothetical protein
MTTKPGLKFSVAAIDNVKEILKALPPAPRETKEVSLREAIEELAPTIRGLLSKGYSRQQIVDLIQEQGVGCSLTSLKAYFRTPVKTKAKSSAGPTAGPTAGTQATGPAAARLVASGGSGGTEVGAAAASWDPAPTHTQSPTARAAGGEGGAGMSATSAAGRAASKAS